MAREEKCSCHLAHEGRTDLSFALSSVRLLHGKSANMQQTSTDSQRQMDQMNVS